MTIDLHAKFQGAMIGSALGDAIGELAFTLGDRKQLLEKIETSKKLVYTDDTAMALALAESLIDSRCINSQRLGDSFREHFHREPWRGYGPGPSQIFSLAEKEGIEYIDAAKQLYDGKGSCGNGAAMRIAPVGLYYYDCEDLYPVAEASARVTHAHPVGVDGAAVMAKAIAMSVMLKFQRPFSPQSFVHELIDFAKTAEIKDKLVLMLELIEDGATAEIAADQLGKDISVQESMPFALYSFFTHPHSFIECILCAVLNGGDRDTMGAMAGAVCGAFLGIAAVPLSWQRKLEKCQYIETLARELAARS